MVTHIIIETVQVNLVYLEAWRDIRLRLVNKTRL